MAVGVNAGRQLNLFMFEVGIIKDPEPGFVPQIIQLVGLHPLVVVPSSIRYADSGRSVATQTDGGALLTKAGRALRSVNFSGNWGVQPRGLGPYVGTGEVRRERFYNEVVRLPDARSAAGVEECINRFTGTPFLRQLLALYDPRDTTFYVNFYDFYNQRAFECKIDRYDDERAYNNAGATGNVRYSLAISEVGPLVQPIGGAGVLKALFAALTTWQDINQAIRSYNVLTLSTSFLGVGALVAAQLSDTIDAFNDQIDAVMSLMGSGAPLAADAQASAIAALGSTFFGTSDLLVAQASLAEADIAARRTGEPDEETGRIRWESIDGEGDVLELARFEAVQQLGEIQSSAQWQAMAGALFGMSPGDFRDWILSGGLGGVLGPVILGTNAYTVTSFDTPTRIESLFGVSWSDILSANNLTPDEALIAGTVLKMPQPRAFGSPKIGGLPTFGSHVGKAAWGVDLDVNGEIVDGRPVLVSAEPVLRQGMLVTIEQFGEELLAAANEAPSLVFERFLAQRLQNAILTDPRIAGIESLDLTFDAQSAALRFEVEATAINGGSIRTAGGAG